jgi:uridylate kinase
MTPKYKRVLLKLSGESLAGDDRFGINFDTAAKIVAPVKTLVENGVQVAIVVGGGNFWRGRSSGEMERTRADKMGMLATVINSLGLQDILESMGLEVKVMSALCMEQVAETFVRDNAVKHLEEGKVVIFAAGTGMPFFSTDTGAALRAAEINAEVILKATMVDGVYDSDPKKNPDAKKYNHIQYLRIIQDNLQVMDMTAASFCNDRKIPFYVFSIEDPENIVRAVSGEDIGTTIDWKED